MIALLISGNEDNIREAIQEALRKAGNTAIEVVKQEGVVKILQKSEFTGLVTLESKVRELSRSLSREKNGDVYKCFLEMVEKPLFEEILSRTDGNQMKAALILGINRNTMRVKIKRLGISPGVYR